MDEDNMSARTPTRSELNTFKVLSNLDFTDLNKREPTNWTKRDLVFPEAEKLSTPQQTPPRISRPPSPALSPSPSPTPSRLPTPRSVHEPEWAKAATEVAADVNIEKEALLYELELMEKQGLIKLHRALTMGNSLEEIQYQYDRSNMIISTQQTVDWAKTSIKMGSNILEALLKKFGVGVVDGFSNNLCKDMTKFNKPLTKMYRKYWRRGTSSPEMELAMIVFGALAMTVMANKGLMGMGPAQATVQAPTQATALVKEESALKPPTMTGFKAPFVAPTVAPTVATVAPTAMPEWARAAMAQPLPQHFAQAPVPKYVPVIDTFPEVSQVPQIPQIQRIDEKPEAEVKRLKLASPKSSRRRKEPVAELNLDES